MSDHDSTTYQSPVPVCIICSELIDGEIRYCGRKQNGCPVQHTFHPACWGRWQLDGRRDNVAVPGCPVCRYGRIAVAREGAVIQNVHDMMLAAIRAAAAELGIQQARLQEYTEDELRLIWRTYYGEEFDGNFRIGSRRTGRIHRPGYRRHRRRLLPSPPADE